MGVADDVLERDHEEVAVRFASRERLGEGGVDLDAVTEELRRLAHRVVEVDGGDDGLAAADAMVLVDDAGDPVALRHEQREELVLLVDGSPFGALLCEELRRAAD